MEFPGIDKDKPESEIKIFLSKQIETITASFNRNYGVVQCSGMTLKYYNTACDLLSGKKNIIYDVPGPNIIFLSIYEADGRIFLYTSLECRLRVPTGRNGASKRKFSDLC